MAYLYTPKVYYNSWPVAYENADYKGAEQPVTADPYLTAPPYPSLSHLTLADIWPLIAVSSSQMSTFT